MSPVDKAWASGLRMGGCPLLVLLRVTISQAEPLVIFLCDVARKQAIYTVIKGAACVNSGPPEEWVEVPPRGVQAKMC